MNAIPSFEELKSSLTPELDILEKKRIKIRNKQLVRIIAFTVLILGICVYLGIISDRLDGGIYLGILFSWLTIHVILHRSNEERFFIRKKSLILL